MRALLLALVLVSPLAYADNENVYDFVFTGSYAPDVPFGGDVPPDTTFVPFTVSFLADSPVLPFPGKGQPFSASLSAYDVNVVVGNQLVLQDGTGAFEFEGHSQISYTPGESAFYFGVGGFSSSALSFSGGLDFGVGFHDPLNGTPYYTDTSLGCFLPSNPDFESLCTAGGRSVLQSRATSAPEPGTLALLAAGLLGLLLTQRARKSA
jgi:hypothetical protein